MIQISTRDCSLIQKIPKHTINAKDVNMIIIDFILFYFNVLRVQDSMQIRKSVITLVNYPLTLKVLQNYHPFKTDHQARTNCPPSTFKEPTKHKLASAQQVEPTNYPLPNKHQSNTHEALTKVSKKSSKYLLPCS